MTLFKQLRSRADQVTLEADKMLRINRKQGEVGQLHKQIEQLTSRLGQTAYGLHKQGQVVAPELAAICSQIDTLYAQVRQTEHEIELIRQEALTVASVTDGVPCVVCKAVIPSGALFCPNCGSQQPKPPPMVLCNSCGKSVPAEARFCAHCGQPVAPSAPTAAPAATVVSPVTPPSLEPEPAPAPTVEPLFERPAYVLDQPQDVMADNVESTAGPAFVSATDVEEVEPLAVDAAVEAATMICSNCQSEIPVEATFCPLCGTPTHQR